MYPVHHGDLQDNPNVNYNYTQSATNQQIYVSTTITTSVMNSYSTCYDQPPANNYSWGHVGGEYGASFPAQAPPPPPPPPQDYYCNTSVPPASYQPSDCWTQQSNNYAQPPPAYTTEWYGQPASMTPATVTDDYTKYYTTQNNTASIPPSATTTMTQSTLPNSTATTESEPVSQNAQLSNSRKRKAEIEDDYYTRRARSRSRSRERRHSRSESFREPRRHTCRRSSRERDPKSRNSGEFRKKFNDDRRDSYDSHSKSFKNTLATSNGNSKARNSNLASASPPHNSKSSSSTASRTHDSLHSHGPRRELAVTPKTTFKNQRHTSSSRHYVTKGPSAHHHGEHHRSYSSTTSRNHNHSNSRKTPEYSKSSEFNSRRISTTKSQHSRQHSYRSHDNSSKSTSKEHYSRSRHSDSGRKSHDTRRPSSKAEHPDFIHDIMKDLEPEDDDFEETANIEKWVRSAPAELYYTRDNSEMKATDRTKSLCDKFETNLLHRAKKAREEAEYLGAEKMKELMEKEAEEFGEEESSTSDSDDSSGDDEKSSKPNRSTAANRELERRKLHPKRLHSELWHNDPGLMNDGPVCRCSAKARRFGIRHGFYPGEDTIYQCNPYSNNPTQLFHYRITITPAKNFLVNSPTVISHDGHDYLFEGFSLFSHYELDLKLPPCKVIRFNIRYDVFVEAEPHPESFCVKELNIFETYLFREVLELVDLKHDWEQNESCSQFHLMPRFVRQLPDNGREILSMNRVLLHLLKHDKELVREEDLSRLLQVDQKEWQNFADKHKGMIVTKWGMKPCALRVDQIDRDITFGKDSPSNAEEGIPYPLIVHFGIRPPQLSYAGNSGYQRAWRRYVKYRHLLSNMPKPSIEEKRKLVAKDLKLRQMRTASTMKRDVTVDISAKDFRTTGICCDLVQHAMLIPVLVGHLRFHKSLATLERRLEYTFQNPYLLQLAMTHPSYRENFGTNPDHARNALTNCGIRQPEYGDRRIHYSSTRKRGINTLINIMARFGAEDETESEITHNERLEFLGDAVVEFATSIHLFHLFPDLEEGGLATYRAAIVQNQHLAELAHNLQLDQFMLYAHGSDLCHDSELRHAMANCFEALMGAIFLDGGIEVADRIFGRTLFENDAELYDIWTNYPKHPLQVQEPKGDRHWINSHIGVLKKLTEFEEIIGLEFTHIRLLARAFTDRSLGYNNLSRGSNQRLEFLGDTVLQLISSEYLYRHFPDHHEGHLSLLRSSLVNNRTQSLVCDDLGMTSYAMRGDPKLELKTKDRADLLEAFLGALYIDKGLKYCIVFCSVCFIPRLSTSIIKQEWNDPKSKLQQCCLTLRTMDGNEPDIPQYKITESKGPTNTRIYVVAVFFRGTRLATAEGHSIQEAEMNAAANALRESEDLFPQLSHQKRIIDKTNKRAK